MVEKVEVVKFVVKRLGKNLELQQIEGNSGPMYRFHFNNCKSLKIEVLSKE